jgi:hypothetical protein
MGGFADLNSFSEEPIEFTDNRAANIIFSSPVTQDQELTTTDFTITVTRPYEIEEIIRPEVTLVSYSIDVSGVAGTTVAWDTVPSGSTVTELNGVYTINGIDDIAEWDIVKDPTITIPADFLGSFFYEVSVNYTTAAGLQTYAWQVGVQVPVSQMIATSALTATVIRIQPLGTINLSAEFGISANTNVTMSPATFNLAFNQTATGNRIAKGRFTRSSKFTLNAVPTVLLAFNNLNVTRTFDKNSTQLLFSDPIIESFPITAGNTYKAVVTVSSGILECDTDLDGNNFGNTVTIQSSSMSSLVYSLNNEVYFTPSFDTNNNLTYTLSIYENDVILNQTGSTNPLNYSGVTEILNSSYTLKTSTVGSFPVDAYAIQYYMPGTRPGKFQVADIIIRGGGGGGAAHIAGGGGGAGGYYIDGNESWTLNDILSANLLTVGQGGQWANPGTNGTDTVATWKGVTYTGPGGGGGGIGVDISKGGSSWGNGNTGAGGNGIFEYGYSAGGGGASGGNAGGDAEVIFFEGNPIVQAGAGQGGSGGRGSSQDPNSYFPGVGGRAAFRSPDPEENSYGVYLGAGGHAGLYNGDGFGNGLEGGVSVVYRTY